MRVLNLEQGSEDWHEARRGVITGTKAKDLFAKNKDGKYSKSRENSIASLAMQRLESAARLSSGGKATERGHEYEAEAAMIYAAERKTEVSLCGFALHEQVDIWGCSPDRLVGKHGVLEIKVPTSVPKHVSYLQDPKVLLDEYEGQCRHNLFITGRDWIDIASYHPEARSPLHLAICRMERPKSWDSYIVELSEADHEIEALIAQLTDKQAAA